MKLSKDKSNWLTDAAMLLQNPEKTIKDVSDGAYSYNDLYELNTAMLMVICKNYPNLCYKSRRYAGLGFNQFTKDDFVLTIETPLGSINQRLNLSMWDHFDVREYTTIVDFDNGLSSLSCAKILSLINYDGWFGTDKGTGPNPWTHVQIRRNNCDYVMVGYRDSDDRWYCLLDSGSRRIDDVIGWKPLAQIKDVKETKNE